MMKSLHRLFILTFLLAVLNQNGFGQSYTPLVKEGATWIITFWEGISGIPGSATYETNQYFFNGDTIVDSVSYKKLYRSQVDSPSHGFDESLISLLREDSNKQVFALPIILPGNAEPQFGCHTQRRDSATEILVYNFDMNVGDTIYHHTSYHSDSTYYTLISIDTVSVSGIPVRAWHFDRALGGGDTWLEGIGSLNGHYYPFCPVFESGYYLACYYDDSIYYRRDTTRYCSVLTIEEFSHSKFSLYPNPNNGVFNIEFNDPLNKVKVVIKNLMGEMVAEQESDHTSSLIIDFDGSKGLYFVSVYSNNQLVGTSKIMKH